jgi:hypothetical protein
MDGLLLDKALNGDKAPGLDGFTMAFSFFFPKLAELC